MDREISFLRDILLHSWLDFDERKNESLVIIVLDIFLFFFYFSRYKQFYEFRDNSVRSKDCVKIDFQILEKVEIFLEAIYFSRK